MEQKSIDDDGVVERGSVGDLRDAMVMGCVTCAEYGFVLVGVGNEG